MVAGQIVALTSSSVAGYRPPNPTIFIIQSVTPTTFNVIATFTSTATGNWTRGASLTAGVSAAGKYQLFWSASAKTSAGANKTYKFEAWQNVAAVDKAAAWSLIDATGPEGFSASAYIVVTAGDIIALLCMNQTDTTDVTIIGMNLRVIRYATP